MKLMKNLIKILSLSLLAISYTVAALVEYPVG